MKKPVYLPTEERMTFLKVVHSFYVYDDRLSSVQDGVLKMLVKVFQIDPARKREYQVYFFSDIKTMAEEVKKITDIGARLMLFKMVWETLLVEKKGILGVSNDKKERFGAAFRQLAEMVSIDINEVKKGLVTPDVDMMLQESDSAQEKGIDDSAKQSVFSAFGIMDKVWKGEQTKTGSDKDGE